jgi:hypothetical protein
MIRLRRDKPEGVVTRFDRSPSGRYLTQVTPDAGYRVRVLVESAGAIFVAIS